MIEDRFVHQSPFEYEYEYEYRFTEYEYDEDRNAFMPERHRHLAAGERYPFQKCTSALRCNGWFVDLLSSSQVADIV